MIEPQELRSRRNRMDGPSRTKSYSLPVTIIEAVATLAKEEGHNNQSTIVSRAIADLLNRQYDRRVA